jgi:2Fe-2S ferredoxin
MSPLDSASKNTNMVSVQPLGADIEVRAGETLYEAATRLGYNWPTRCFGQAQCTLCALRIEAGGDNVLAPDLEEQSVVQRVHSMRGGGPYRLACRLQVTGPVVVRKDGVSKSA